MSTGKIFIEETIKSFKGLKSNTEKALEQLADSELHWSMNEESNSIAIIMKHISGNMISRWTDFLTTDGEKPDRNRDSEFIDEFTSRQQLMDYWNRGWTVCIDSLSSLSENDLEKIIYIRNEPHTVVRAMQRGLAHIAYHCGQIVYVAKQLKGGDFKSLSIPRGESAKYVQEPPKTGNL
jgi:hypothetical protein